MAANSVKPGEISSDQLSEAQASEEKVPAFQDKESSLEKSCKIASGSSFDQVYDANDKYSEEFEEEFRTVSEPNVSSEKS